MPTLADVNPVAEVLSWLQGHTGLIAVLGSSAHVTGLVEPPYPHVQVSPGAGGDYRELVWAVAPEVVVSTWGNVDGTPGQAALRAIHQLALAACAEIPRRQHITGQTVVSRVTPSSSVVPAGTPLGSRGWTTTLSVVCHPGV
jgi:hypothetical protein